MTKVYVALAVADSMFPSTCFVSRLEADIPLVHKVLEPSELEPVINACNPSHRATLRALRKQYDIDLESTIAERPPVVKLERRDILLVISVRGLPRLTDRHEYTDEEIAQAHFSFGIWRVVEVLPL